MKDLALLAEVSNAAAMFQSTLGQSPDVATETIQAWEMISRMLSAMQQIHPTTALAKVTIEAGLRSMKVGGMYPTALSLLFRNTK